jgi:4-hydroxybenzoate polyprenyltransferase
MVLATRRQYRVLIIKLLALLSLVRWQNILLTALAQYVAALVTLNRDVSIWSTLSNSDLHLIVFSTAFIIAGGYIINSFYDLEKDLVNRPDKTILDRLISKTFCLNTYILFNVIGLMLAFLASFHILIFFSFFAFALWFYSHKLQKIAVIGELSASILNVASFFSIGLYYHLFQSHYFIYGAWMLTLIFSRELVKGIESIKGDAMFGYDTIPLQLGIKRTRNMLISIGIISMIPLFGVYIFVHHFWFRMLICMAGLLTLHSVYILRKLQQPSSFSKVNLRLKLLIVAGIIGIVFL